MHSWFKQLEQRIVASGDTSPHQWHLVGDLFAIASIETAGWTNRPDDAIRIPDVLSDAERFCRSRALAYIGKDPQ